MPHPAQAFLGQYKPCPIISLLIHVTDWRSGTEWYARAFPGATRIHHEPDDFGHLDVDGIALEIIDADAKVGNGAAGTVVYWRVADIDKEVARLQEIGARLYRGPMDIEGNERICQVQDPWGNCIGLRQARPPALPHRY
jgi:predicted enzyme related to lactoylglutathione lyase